MAKGIGHFIVIIKAIFTRVMFATHGFIAIWRVTSIKNDPYYWYLCASILALTFEGVFTLTIKKNQEWKWFCPSVFFYLCSVVPAIWLLEVDKFDRKLALKIQAELNLTAVKISNEELAAIDTFGVELKIPVQLDAETWATVIEQLLMLILIIGRWMLPKGGLTRDQLSQLLLVYIGTAADIIEFFDSFKDDKISSQRVLCLLILSIWSWSLLQFTFVLTATKSRRTRITADIDPPKPKFVNGIYKVKEVCCSIDVWGILINIILQDAPFLIFRMLLITYYKIISYMNIFFTCKNTLVIILQFYRLYVVQQEKNKEISKLVKANTVSGNLAKAVERAAFMGPTADPKIKASRTNANAKRAGTSGPSCSKTSKAQVIAQTHAQPKKHRSQDSITSQNNKILEAARRERAKTGRRKSLSTGNLPEGCEDAFEADKRFEDDLEMGMSGSVLSGTNDQDSQEEESEVPLDDLSVTSERPKVNRKIRMSENPGIYKISGSRSSAASSDQGHGRCRQDTGYSSSSKDSANSGRRGRAIVNGGSRTGRISGGAGSRSRSAAQRRRQMVIAKELNDIEYGGMNMEGGQASSELSEDSENERIFQRRAAIGAVFSLFIVIFILCMVAIYGGINPKGLVLRETFRVANSTKPRTTTTTPEPPPTTTTIITMTKQMPSTVPNVINIEKPENSSKTLDFETTGPSGFENKFVIPKENTTITFGVNRDNSTAPSTVFQEFIERGEASQDSKEKKSFTSTTNQIPVDLESDFKSSIFSSNNAEQIQEDFEEKHFTSISTSPNSIKNDAVLVRHARNKIKRLYKVLNREWTRVLNSEFQF